MQVQRSRLFPNAEEGCLLETFVLIVAPRVPQVNGVHWSIWFFIPVEQNVYQSNEASKSITWTTAQEWACHQAKGMLGDREGKLGHPPKQQQLRVYIRINFKRRNINSKTYISAHLNIVSVANFKSCFVVTFIPKLKKESRNDWEFNAPVSVKTEYLLSSANMYDETAR